MTEEPIDLVPLIRQRLAEDMLPADHDYWDILDLCPASPEGLDAAHEESSIRMASVIPLQKFVEVYSLLCADIISQVMYKNLKRNLEDEVPEEYIETWRKTTVSQNREIVRGSLYPILAHLIDARVLTYGPEVF